MEIERGKDEREREREEGPVLWSPVRTRSSNISSLLDISRHISIKEVVFKLRPRIRHPSAAKLVSGGDFHTNDRCR